jgi:hypothetical protein
MLGSCGGNGELLSCFFECKNCKPDKCTQVCPKNQDDFVARMIEVGGFSNTTIRPVKQRGIGPFPRYLPVIYSNTRRLVPLAREMVAVPLWRMIGGTPNQYRLLVESEPELREKFLISKNTKFLTIGAGYDQKLENFWANIHRPELLQGLLKAGVGALTIPNYSFFTDMMGPTIMYNFRRLLLATEALSEAGLQPIPHLNALKQRDWNNWHSFMKDQPEIRVVAKEFATGLASYELGAQQLRHLGDLQQKLGYPLHVVAIGGSQYARNLNSLFADWTVTDADPYIKTVKFQVPHVQRGMRVWKTCRLPRTAKLDDRLHQLIHFGQKSLEEQVPPIPLVTTPLPTGQFELSLGL